MRPPDPGFGFDRSVSLTTEPERFTDLAWDLLLGAQDQARRWRHGELDVEHLFQALLQEPRCRELLEPLGLDGNRLLDELDDFCGQQPARGGAEL